jgi:hypothetical protein
VSADSPAAIGLDCFESGWPGEAIFKVLPDHLFCMSHSQHSTTSLFKSAGKMKILIDQKGGLGNQLFQYAAGLYFARKYEAALEIVKEAVNLAATFGHPRPLLLSKFCISARFRNRTLWDRMMCSFAWYKKPLVVPARIISGTQFYSQPYSAYNAFLASLPIASTTRNLYLNGNFQAYSFAQGVEQQLREEIQLKEAPSGKNLEMLNEIQACMNSVSLHIRLGDYTFNSGGRSLLPMAYYRRAIQAMNERVANPTLFIFSDEIESARASLPTLERMVFVDHNSEETAHEDMRLMSACRHNIMANSTFSWWGAWLNPNPEKHVLYPDRWFNLNPIPADLMPPTWQSISTEDSSA